MSQEDRPMDDVINWPPEVDEVDGVLAALKGLLEKVASPVVRSCLAEAHDDIAYLTGKDPAPADAPVEEDAA
jgi:hypothetical protein